MTDSNQVVTKANLGLSLKPDSGTSKIDVDITHVDVTAATNIAATDLLAALSEIGARLVAAGH